MKIVNRTYPDYDSRVLLNENGDYKRFNLECSRESGELPVVHIWDKDLAKYCDFSLLPAEDQRAINKIVEDLYQDEFEPFVPPEQFARWRHLSADLAETIRELNERNGFGR